MEETHVSRSTQIGWGILILTLGFFGGYEVASQKAVAEVRAGQPESVDFTPLWRAWAVIDEKFVPASVSTSTPVATTTEQINRERVWGMISGLAGSLKDPYTFFLPTDESQQFTEDMSGRFEGVGMEIAVRDQVLTVVT